MFAPAAEHAATPNTLPVRSPAPATNPAPFYATARNGDKWTGEKEGELWIYEAMGEDDRGSLYASAEVPAYRIVMDNARIVMVDGRPSIAPMPEPHPMPASPARPPAARPAVTIYPGPFPRARHAHRCARCGRGRSVYCYKKQCDKPRDISTCSFCR